MVNLSKTKEKRFWDKWESSCAVGNANTAVFNQMKNIAGSSLDSVASVAVSEISNPKEMNNFYVGYVEHIFNRIKAFYTISFAEAYVQGQLDSAIRKKDISLLSKWGKAAKNNSNYFSKVYL